MMMQKISVRAVVVFLALFYSGLCAAQPSGTVRGVVTDGVSRQPLPFVTVQVRNSSPAIGAVTDEQGRFSLTNLPIGRYDIETSLVGYEPSITREVLVSSAREVFLEIVMRENVQMLSEVVVRPRVNKESPLNEMTLVGARMLNVEEASRFAGGFDDPARLVTAFAGVAGGVTSNAISVRGNSPQFLQWRLEDVETVNPTHFSDVSGVGGGVLTALSSQMLDNSDFFMSAFPAEFGNAISGIFDMQLRNGNNQTYEHTAQIGTLGVEFGSEGPLKKGARASYLFNYRYSSMALVGDLLPDLVGDAASLRYQDLSFKVNLPTRRAGVFSVYGFGTKDHYTINNNLPDFKALGNEDIQQTKAVGGVGHSLFLNENMFVKSNISTNYNFNVGEMNHFDGETEHRVLDMHNTKYDVAFSSFVNTKFSSRHANRTGFTATGLFYNLDYQTVENPFAVPPGEMHTVGSGSGHTMAYQAFTQSLVQFTDQLSANVGLHGSYFALTEKAVVEPRASLRWRAFPRHSFGIAYGKHSRRENTDYYFVKTPETGDELVNRHLDFAKAQHFVLLYDWSIFQNLHLKVEPYLQILYDIPVGNDGTMSIINQRYFWMLDALSNDGKGRNYGIDLTLERYLYGGYYYLLTTSLFQSRYTGSDGVWRNTRFNRNFVINALGGKEWKMGRNRQNMLSANARATLQGGERYTPFDEAASIATQTVVYDNERAWENQLNTQFLLSFTVSYKINKAKTSHEFALKMINATQAKEPSFSGFNFAANRPEYYMNAISIPNISYTINF
ncbi:MAG: TonB-dependent receptor [Bacteroidales bacterium]|jgi:hypothetical protein|nr:TonB-dependent receptor [Bacteroidales bacterium]